MADEGIKEFMKRAYPDLVDFENLQFVKSCKEEAIKEYKEEIKIIIASILAAMNKSENLKTFVTALCDQLNLGCTIRDLEK